MATPLAFGAAAVVRGLGDLTSRLLGDAGVLACVPRPLLLRSEASCWTLEGCVLRASTLGFLATRTVLLSPCAAVKATTGLRQLPGHLDEGVACCLCALPVALPFGLLANCALVGVKVVRLLCASGMSAATEAALARCEDQRSVARLRKRLCSWDAATETLIVRGSAEDALLQLQLCAGLPRLRVLGPDVMIVVRDPAQTLPEGMQVSGSLAIVGAVYAGWEPPTRLSVGGMLGIYNLGPTRALERISVGTDFVLTSSRPLDVLLGGAIAVGGQLRIRNCSSLSLVAGQTEISSGLALPAGTLELLPEGLRRVRGDLDLQGCAQLRALPHGLAVDGALCVRRCGRLAALPGELEVGGSLLASQCTSLTTLPESIRVRGAALELSRCRSLTLVPLDPLLQPRESEITVYVRDSGVTGVALAALRVLQSQTVRIATTLFMVDDDAEEEAPAAEEPPQQQQQAEEAPRVRQLAASRSVRTLADAERVFCVSAAALREAIDPAYVRGVLRFLDKLLGAAEARSAQLYDGLVLRAREVLQLVIDDAEARDELVLRMCDAADACSDKLAWALGQMQLVSIIARARGDRAKLRRLGRGVMRLDIVHEHAQRYVAETRADDVSVILRFEIALRDALKLPVSAQQMLYGAHVSAAAIGRAREAALAVSEAEFARWLETWEEWRRQRRLEAVVPYALLVPFPGDFPEADEDDDEPVRDPVYALPDTSNVWSYADLCAHWVRTGMDFSNSVVGAEDFVGLVVRRLSDDAAAAARVPLRESLRRRLSIFAKTSSGDAQLAPSPQDPFSR